MYILGINESHLATAAILKDGQIIACASEERFTRIKNQGGFPFKACQFCLDWVGITIKDIDLVVFGYEDITGSMIYAKKQKNNKTALFLTSIKERLFSGYYFFYNFFPSSFYIYKIIKFIIHNITFRIIRKLYVNDLSKSIGLDKKRVFFLKHHNAHAFAANYIFGLTDEKRLVITNDGSGDNYSGKVFASFKNELKQIAVTPNDSSLAYIYYYVTRLLGFRPDEEEYKVMGLAPYADSRNVDKIYPIFKEIIDVKGLSFISKIPREIYFNYLKRKLEGVRFDVIAGAVQKLTEELTVKQVENAILKTGSKEVILGGGLAMNIKANLKVGKIKNLSSLQVCPSAGDESTAIGCCFWGYKKLCQENGLEFKPKQLTNLYLGPIFGKEIEKVTGEIKGKKGYKVKRVRRQNIAKVVAKLLAKGNIVARFSGRMEFGARALGNRSILADPRNPQIIKVINETIKRRDFWMPFAPTILKDRVDDYLINPKKLDSPFMMIGFDTTKKAQQDIPATLHPHDLTCRPQILKKEENPDYYNLIKEFDNLTGVGAVLNTSFNLHGEPIVCTPFDAISTFQKSGLKYLLIEDFLIQKI